MRPVILRRRGRCEHLRDPRNAPRRRRMDEPELAVDGRSPWGLITGCGMGVVASRSFARGERVVSEERRWSRGRVSKESTPPRFDQRLKRLCRSARCISRYMYRLTLRRKSVVIRKRNRSLQRFHLGLPGHCTRVGTIRTRPTGADSAATIEPASRDDRPNDQWELEMGAGRARCASV